MSGNPGLTSASAHPTEEEIEASHLQTSAIVFPLRPFSNVECGQPGNILNFSFVRESLPPPPLKQCWTPPPTPKTMLGQKRFKKNHKQSGDVFSTLFSGGGVD